MKTSRKLWEHAAHSGHSQKPPKTAAEKDRSDEKAQDKLEEIDLTPLEVDTDEGIMAAEDFFDKEGLVVVYVHKDEEKLKWFTKKMITETLNTVVENRP